MQMNPYIMFNGQCEAAFKFYEKHLGAKIVFMLTHANSPAAEHTPRDRQDKILHGRIIIDGQVLMGSDAPPERYDKPKGFFISLGVTKTEEAERLYKALSEKAEIIMPLEETFWAHRFAMLVDQFGIPWMINCEKEGAAS